MVDRMSVAILDMNNGFPNQGLRCIKEIVAQFADEVSFEVFDVRQFNEIPDLSFDIYISSGGPGSPLLEGLPWEAPYFKLLEDVYAFNKSDKGNKKYMFLICHSFQLACGFFKLGELTKRKSTSFGIHPVHKTRAGYKDELFRELPDPFFVVESRDWQVIQPDLATFEKKGCELLALEKMRSHVDYERALMAVKFSDEIYGTQFHPEADPVGLDKYLRMDDTREKLVSQFGEEKYLRTLAQTANPNKIELTKEMILPGFIRNCIHKMQHLEMT
ncbi:MAG: GMP synthase [Saprospiraceae bacterium]|nr:GMP synthase [Saprospiraceae bacterium]